MRLLQQLFDDASINRLMLALVIDVAVPMQAENFQVFDDASIGASYIARRVDIIDAQ